MELISAADISPFADINPDRLAAMIADAEAMAKAVAPCLGEPGSTADPDVVKAILRRAILRWHATGVSGQVSQQTTGPYSQTIQQTGSRGLFLPSEISQLQNLCGRKSVFYAIEMAGPPT